MVGIRMSGRFELIHLVLALNLVWLVSGQIWPPPNAIDEIRERMMIVNVENCDDLDIDDLRLPFDTLSQLPHYYEISNKLHHVNENRTGLYFQHNLVLNRAIYMSFSNSKFNESSGFYEQPDWLYHYTSNWADIMPEIGLVNGSGLFYDQNKTYANWYPSQDLHFNRTLGLFGPRSWREIPCANESLCGSLNELHSTDYGADGDNYTSSKHSPWYALYLPDDTPGLDMVRKVSHLVTLKYANNSSEMPLVFFTHALSLEEDFEFLPVVYTQPYYDCGRSNEWIVSAASPFIDHIPRYLDWMHLRRFTFTGEAVVDVEFNAIDINPCPLGVGNEEPNYFASSALCKPTTVCEPLTGFGFQRGGYQCVCQPGLAYPPEQEGPFQGIDIESASWADYQAGFDCILAERLALHLKQEGPKPRGKIVPRYAFREHIQDQKFDPMQQLRIDALLQKKSFIKDQHCPTLSREQLLLPEELTYTVDSQFKTQARMATRLAHFLSNYLQNVFPEGTLKDDPGFLPDKLFHVDHLYGEALAIVMSDVYIRSSGIYFDGGKFKASDGVDRPYFAPFAYKNNITAENSEWSVVDAVDIEPFYADDLWFIHLKEVWDEDLVGLHHSALNLAVRSNVNGDDIIIHDRSPFESYTASVDEGLWWGPYHKCDGFINDWVVSYAAPFFGISDDNPAVLEFQGAVTVDILLDDLEPNQCDTDPRNLWSNTAKCNFRTSKCEPTKTHGFQVGSYRCVCLHNNSWISGHLLETEFTKMLAGLENRYSFLQDHCD